MKDLFQQIHQNNSTVDAMHSAFSQHIYSSIRIKQSTLIHQTHIDYRGLQEVSLGC